MSLFSSLTPIGLLLAAMVAFSFVEAVIPLCARSALNRRHLLPNLALTFLTFASNLLLNIPLLLGLVWLQARGWGLLNTLDMPLWAALLVSVVVLDLAWYATHTSLHAAPALWRFHAVHHSDLAVDVTTTIRQHPGEGLIRYGFLAVFAFAFGVPPQGFALYRIWSALHGFLEHANIALPRPLDRAITTVFSSPDMHKVHHARDARLTDTNYGNIFSIWDQAFGTFTPSRFGRGVVYGLSGYDEPRHQSTAGLLRSPFGAGPTASLASEQAASPERP